MMNSKSKMWLKIWSIVLGVFLLGCVTGAGLNGIYMSRASVDSAPPSIRDGEAYFRVLKRELSLSREQESAISQILNDTRDEYKTVCSEVRPRYNVLESRPARASASACCLTSNSNSTPSSHRRIATAPTRKKAASIRKIFNSGTLFGRACNRDSVSRV